MAQNQPAPNAQLFISYSRSDRIAVDKLVADLRQRNYKLWMDVDEQGIEPGDDWQNKLVAEMSAARGVIACVSPDFLTSPFCRAEIEQAQREGKPIYPVILRRLGPDHTLADFKLDHLQFIDLAADYAAGLKRLLPVLPRPALPLRSIVRRLAFTVLVFGALIGLLVGIAFTTRAVTYIPPTAIPPTATVSLNNYDVGMLVSYFVLKPPAGLDKAALDTLQVQSDALIERFSQALDTQLSSDLAKSGLNLTYALDGPQSVRRITGLEAQDRKEQAAQLARERGAKVVVYGVVGYDDVLKSLELEPEFYVSADRYFGDALDMTGSYAFGQNIPADSLDDRGKLGARVTALSYIVTGVFQHMTQQYDGALKSFNAALAVPNWDDPSGKDVLFTLIGQTTLKFAEAAARVCDRQTVLDRAQEAENAYLTSQKYADQLGRTDYVRAYAGLANTYAIRALWLSPKNDKCAAQFINIPALQDALGWVQKYRDNLVPASLDPGVQKKLQLTEAQVRFFLWATPDPKQTADQKADQLKQFSALIDQIVGGYDSKSDSTMASPVMEAYIMRGQSRYAQSAFRPALEDYDAALAIFTDVGSPLIAPDRAMTVYGWKADVYMRLTDYQQAATFYGMALTIAKDIAKKNNTSTSATISYYEAAQQRADLFSVSTPTPAPGSTPAAKSTAPANPTNTTRPTEEVF